LLTLRIQRGNKQASNYQQPIHKFPVWLAL
jgi:hypothetical protein